jgi:hypothetical protein
MEVTMMWNGFGMDGFGGLGMVIVAVIVIVGIVMLMRWFSSNFRRK